jgi:hypothetical protein
MRLIDKLGEMFSKATSEIGEEIDRLVVQGSAEFASALFTGNAYVPYGQGQNRAGVEHGMEGLGGHEQAEHQQEHEGRSM